MNRAAIASIALGTALACMAPSGARAWECLQSSCPVWCELPVGYQIGALPPGLDEDEALAEIHRAFDDWEAVECSRLTFTYEGRIPEGGATTPISVEWLTDWPTRHPSSAISIAGTSWSMEGDCMESAPIEHNASDFAWRIEAAGGADVHVYTGTMFAIGLSVGLGTTDDPSALMYRTYSGPKSLGDDDIEGVCALYATGGLGTCDRCFGDETCGEEADLCVAYPDGKSYCGKACTDGGGECAADEECADVDGSMQCVRLMEGERACRAPGTGESCTPCSDSGECAGECLRYPSGESFCAARCTGPDDCHADEQCVATGGGGDPFCVRFVDDEPTCEELPPGDDAGLPDASAPPLDAGTPDPGDEDDDGGCSCRAVSPGQAAPTWAALALVIGWIARRRRR